MEKDLVAFNVINLNAQDIVDVSEGNTDNIYGILIQYYSHFMHPLNQSLKFYKGFIRYALKKGRDLEIFKRALNYVEDIETFLFVINENKEQIFKQYEKLKTYPIEMNGSLKLVKYKSDKTKKFNKDKNKINDNTDNESDHSDEDNTKGLDLLNGIENECYFIINLIEQIIKFSEKEKTLNIYLKSEFWINLIKEYNIPDLENIIAIKLKMI